MLCGCALDVLGLLCNTLCLLRSNPYQSLFVTALANIFAEIQQMNGGTIAKHSNDSLQTLSVPGTSSIVLNAFDVKPN
ncbi:hypothetical protein niasHT_025156 [Heterodera trifolii]|uniref:Uncharacterized protein n=1 Tax=Heterodera trifolii TaxID=157864 RepID=A0ABD2JL89_9BILA